MSSTLDVFHTKVVPSIYGAAGKCVGIAQGGWYALKSLSGWEKQAPEENEQQNGQPHSPSSKHEFPEKRQRLRSPEPEPQKQQDQPVEQPSSHAAQQQPKEQHAEDPTPHEAYQNEQPAVDPVAGVEGPITKLADVTGVQQPQKPFATAVAKPAADATPAENQADALQKQQLAEPSSFAAAAAKPAAPDVVTAEAAQNGTPATSGSSSTSEAAASRGPAASNPNSTAAIGGGGSGGNKKRRKRGRGGK